MLLGEFSSLIGEKNRIALPKKIRDEFKGKIIVTRGYENCLIILDTERWNNLLSSINKNPLLSLNVRDTKRFLLGGATEIEYDTQGRFVLPESLKSYAELVEKIVFLGVGEWAEIWNEETWKRKLENLNKNVSDLAEKLGSI